MPRSRSTCNFPGCPNIAVRRGRCDLHAGRADRDHAAASAPYKVGPHLTRFRPGVLARDPICVVCRLVKATRADHYPRSRKQLLAAGLDPNDPQYGRGLCETCHNRHTGRTAGGGFMGNR